MSRRPRQMAGEDWMMREKRGSTGVGRTVKLCRRFLERIMKTGRLFMRFSCYITPVS
jgi:hypothetical protein